MPIFVAVGKGNIAIVGSAYPYRGGQALVEGHLFTTLTDAGYEVNTFTFSRMYPKLFFPGETQYDTSETVFFDHRDKIERSIDSIGPASWKRTAKAINALAPDMVVFVWWMPFFGPCYRGIIKHLDKNIKRVFLIENHISHEARWFDRSQSRRTLKLADHFICQSQFTADSVTKDHPAIPIWRTTLSVFDCYDLKRYDKESARKKLGIESKHVVLFFGLIRQYKGLDRFIAAMPKVLKEAPDTMGLIVGEAYEDIGPYKEQIAQLGLDEHIKMVNAFIPNEEIEPWFKAADLICLPYRSATQSGITMIAYGMRRPVVVTDVGGLKELVVPGRTGEVVPNDDLEALAKAVVKVLRDSEAIEHAAHIANLTKELGYLELPEMVDKMLTNH